MYDGCKLVKDGNIVFVTLNYRLGALGFLALPELRDVTANRAVGNWGLMVRAIHFFAVSNCHTF